MDHRSQHRQPFQAHDFEQMQQRDQHLASEPTFATQRLVILDEYQQPQNQQQLHINPHFQPQQSQPHQPSQYQQQAQVITDVNSHQQQAEQNQPQYDNTDDVLQQLMILARETQKADGRVQLNREYFQEMVIQIQNRKRLMTALNLNQIDHGLDRSQVERECNRVSMALRQKSIQIENVRRESLAIQHSILDALMKWKERIMEFYLPRWNQEQQKTNNGLPIETINLDTIQSWVEKIVEIIWRIKNQIKCVQLTFQYKVNHMRNETEQFNIYVNKTLRELILGSFVVEKQPPQVMKTNTRFTATVRFLCGNKLNVQMINPTVKALILSEQNARTVIKYHKHLIAETLANDERMVTQTFATTQSPSSYGNTPTSTKSPPNMMSTQSGVPQTSNATANMMTKPTMDQQGHNMFYDTTHNSHDGSQVSMCLSPEQSLSVGEQSPTYGQNFQQQQQQQQQQQPRYMGVISAPTNMTANQSYGGMTEIGYNPDVPIQSKDFECSGEILNNSNILEFHETTGHMVSQFKNMQLKKIKRTEKKGTESVMDEKFILLFYTEFRIADDSFLQDSDSALRSRRGDLLFHILAFSLPVVVIVHGNQEPHAWATVTWHNAFATPDDVLYSVPDRVPWRELGNVLSEKFRAHAGRGLSQPNLRYLASKVYRNRADNDDVLITWNQFSKEPLSDKSFTFWEWFHSILKLTKDHLGQLWKAERIYGFIGKKGCVDLLLGAFSEPAQVGTFLLRFSETELGGITIAWVSSSSELSAMNPSLNDCVQVSQRLSPTNTSSNVVMHLQPFITKDLNTRSLADRIRDLKDLVYLYPNIPKDDAFEAYYTPINHMPSRPGEGYIKSLLVTTLEKNYPGTSNQNTETSVTPNSMSQNSPDGFYQENGSINDAMDSSFSPYDPCTTDFSNYTIHNQ